MRYFYTDPLAAAWMAKHFRMRFQETYNNHATYVEVPPAAIRAQSSHTSVQPVYIHPDSLHLLEPQVGDLVLARNDFAQYLAFVQEDGLAKCNHIMPQVMLSQSEDCPFRVTSIIQRNGIAFHWPEREGA